MPLFELFLFFIYLSLRKLACYYLKKKLFSDKNVSMKTKYKKKTFLIKIINNVHYSNILKS